MAKKQQDKKQQAKKQRQGLIFFIEHMQAARKALTVQERGALYDALLEYGTEGREPPAMEGASGVLFDLMRQALDRDAERYQETCIRNQKIAREREEARRVTTCTNTTQPNSTQLNITQPNSTERNAAQQSAGGTPALKDRAEDERRRTKDDDVVWWN